MTAPVQCVAVSDSTGETAAASARAALAQFGSFPDAAVRVFPNVLDVDTLEQVVRLAKKEGALVVYTLVRNDLRERIVELSLEHDVVAIDLLGRLMGRLARQLGRRPLFVPGLGHEMDEDYFRRIEAIEFAVYNDDGKIPRNLKRAEIVLVGISRTSKTPLSNYIAQRGYKVANVPIVLDIPLPKEIEDVDPRRVFGLLIDAVTLMRIRQTRLENIGMEAGSSDYGDLRQIRREIAYARRIFAEHPEWTVIDISKKAIEETASTVVEAYGRNFELAPEAAAKKKQKKKASKRASRKGR